MIKVAICDDEKNTVDEIESLIRKNERGSSLSICKFYSGVELIDNVAEGKNFDLIFLDIEMQDIDGIETAQEIRKTNKTAKIIFITSYKDYAPKAFEVSAFRFLTKPIVDEKFNNYFELVINEIEEDSSTIIFQSGKGNFRVEIKDIIYFESVGRVLNIVTNSGILNCYEKLSSVEERLFNDGIIFLRITQSFLINPKYIKMSTTKKFILKNDEEFTIAKSKREQIGKLYCDLMCGGVNDRL